MAFNSIIFLDDDPRLRFNCSKSLFASFSNNNDKSDIYSPFSSDLLDMITDFSKVR